MTTDDNRAKNAYSIAVNLGIHLFVYFLERSCKNLVCTRLAGERLANDHESVPHDHHFIDLCTHDACVQIR